MSKNPAIFANIIYRFKRGRVPSESSNPKRYKYLILQEDWEDLTGVGDVWICDENGNIDPGNDVSPVPVERELIGVPMRRFNRREE